MAYTKKIICLAKSRKKGALCFAGKEILPNGSVGEWIRPVSSRETEAISYKDCEYEDHSYPELLDIIEITFEEHRPNLFQCENHLIDDDYYWEKKGRFTDLINICDNPSILWNASDSSCYGHYDRVAVGLSKYLENSIYLITPDSLSIRVQWEGEEFYNPSRKVRANFIYNDMKYILSLTDPDIENEYLRRTDGEYNIINPKDQIFLCVSIGLPYCNKHCYKFVASILQ